MWEEWRKLMFPKAVEVADYLEGEVQRMRDLGMRIHPDQCDIFRAMDLVGPSDVKVLILGQDPYHGDNEADGLAFSTRATKRPPSLRNIYKELETDIGVPFPSSGDLTPWARQGVLLLNTVLTVEHKSPNSHKGLGWQRVTDEILNVVLEQPQPVVCIAWGRQAQVQLPSVEVYEHPNKALIYSTHPSPLSAYTNTYECCAFIGSKPFSRTNELLCQMGASPVDWTLP